MFIVRGKAINVQYIFFLWFPIVFAYVNIPALPFSKKKKEKTVSSNCQSKMKMSRKTRSY